MTNGLLVAGGVVALVVGADVLVRAGAALAAWLGIRPMMVGLTVVSLGTSVPELAVGIDAARSGNPGLAVGNIIGANLVNILLILGLSAALVPIALDRATLRFDLPAMAAAALLIYVLSIDGTLTRPDGVVLLLAAVVYTVVLVQVSRRATAGRPRRRRPTSGRMRFAVGRGARRVSCSSPSSWSSSGPGSSSTGPSRSPGHSG